MLEERGHESLFFAEHAHIPVTSMGSWSGEGGLPPRYWHCYDVFVALTAAATATTKLRVGSGIFERARQLRARADRPVEVHVVGVPADPQELERVRDAGMRRALHWLLSGARGPVERALERWEAAIAELNGE